MSRPAWVLPFTPPLPPDTTNRPHRAFSMLYIDLFLVSRLLRIPFALQSSSKKGLLSVSGSHSVSFWAPQWQTD